MTPLPSDLARAREIVDQHLWPTEDGPFVRVNGHARDLERLTAAIAAALAALREELAKAVETRYSPFPPSDELLEIAAAIRAPRPSRGEAGR